MKFPLTLSICLLLLSLVCGTNCFAEDITVAFWNVENLFDNRMDRRSSREDLFTPSELREKLRKDGEILKELNADIVGLMEVENRGILQQLNKEELSELGYHYVALMDESDERGIDVALLSRFPVLCQSVPVPGFYRGLLVARVVVSGRPLYVVVNHWKSRYGGGEGQRMACSQTLIQLVSQTIPEMEGTHDVFIIAGGDFNDNDTDESVVHLEEQGLTNHLKHLPLDQRWTLPYDNREEFRVEFDSFDHIFTNQANEAATGIQLLSATVVRPERMLTTRRLYGKDYLWPDDDQIGHIGYSDHFPVVAKLRVTPKQ